MIKSEMKRRLQREPFRDVSNRLIAPRKSPTKKTASEVEADLPQEDGVDRLLLIHSDISNILRQIDELVVQAVQAEETKSQQKKEIVSFTNALAEIQSSLKPWVPRFQEAFSGLSTKAKDQPTQASTSTRTLPIEEDDNVVRSPEPTMLDLLVSPSPLVSWRAGDCTVEWGKQLFVPSPLPTPKTVITTSQPLSKSVALGRLASGSTTASGFPSRLAVVFEPKNDNLEKLVEKSASEYLAAARRFKEPSISRFPSPAKSAAKGDCPITILATPRLKASPAKSSILLEPNLERSSINFCQFRKSTPFSFKNQKLDELEDDSETSSSNEPSEEPEPEFEFTNLLGIKPVSELGKAKKDVYASPPWYRSPPRSCTLMDPTEEKSLKFEPLNLSDLDVFAGSVKCNASAVQRNGLPSAKPINKSDAFVGLTHSTPVWKEPSSTAHRRRPPGENTLKRELWTKFEAASMGGSSLKLPALEEEEAALGKGFLDRLEEEAL